MKFILNLPTINLFLFTCVFSTGISTSYASGETQKTKKKLNISEDFASLGDNKDVVDRARQLSFDKKVLVVQNRLVDRNLRFEFSASYTAMGGGDGYVNTQNLGGHVDFHITPRWSVGVRYDRSYNVLTEEGRQMYDNAQGLVNQQGPNTPYIVPQVDAPMNTTMAVLNWYPFYGKLNLLDLGVAHFDVYTLAGYGQMKLQTGVSGVSTGGIGIGFWWSQHFTSRTEISYQSYRDLIGSYDRKQGAILGTFSIGVML